MDSYVPLVSQPLVSQLGYSLLTLDTNLVVYNTRCGQHGHAKVRERQVWHVKL